MVLQPSSAATQWHHATRFRRFESLGFEPKRFNLGGSESVTLPVAVLLMDVLRNRMEHLEPVVANRLPAIDCLEPQTLRRVAA